VVEEKVRAWRERPLSSEYYAIYLDGTFLSVRRGQAAKEPVYLTLGRLRARWGLAYPKIVGRWEAKAYALFYVI
jgi:hypothetical protein